MRAVLVWVLAVKGKIEMGSEPVNKVTDAAFAVGWDVRLVVRGWDGWRLCVVGPVHEGLDERRSEDGEGG